MTSDGALIVRSLQRAADLIPDPTGLVYERLFSLHPHMEPLFIRDTNGSVRGEMLAKVFEIILDLVADRRYAANMIRCEVVTHAGYGVPADVFWTFFDVLSEVIGEQLGDDWTAETEGAWARLLLNVRALPR